MDIILFFGAEMNKEKVKLKMLFTGIVTLKKFITVLQ